MEMIGMINIQKGLVGQCLKSRAVPCCLRRRFRRAGEHKTGGEEQRLRVFVELAAYRASADRQCVDVVIFVHVCVKNKK